MNNTINLSCKYEYDKVHKTSKKQSANIKCMHSMVKRDIKKNKKVKTNKKDKKTIKDKKTKKNKKDKKIKKAKKDKTKKKQKR